MSREERLQLMREQFHQNPNINPESRRRIKEGGPTYRYLVKKYGQPPSQISQQVVSPRRSPRQVVSPSQVSQQVVSPSRSPQQVVSPSRSPRQSLSTRQPLSPSRSPQQVVSPSRSSEQPLSPSRFRQQVVSPSQYPSRFVSSPQVSSEYSPPRTMYEIRKQRKAEAETMKGSRELISGGRSSSIISPTSAIASSSSAKISPNFSKRSSASLVGSSSPYIARSTSNRGNPAIMRGSMLAAQSGTSNGDLYIYVGDFHFPFGQEWTEMKIELSDDLDKLKGIQNMDIADVLDEMEEEGLKSFLESGVRRSGDDNIYKYIFIDNGFGEGYTLYYTSAIVKRSIQ